MTYAISGASGQLGRIAATALLDRVDPTEVVLLTRSPEKLADLAAKGAVVRQADFDDVAGLQRALEGVERLLIISTDAVGSRLGQQKGAIDAAKAAGVRHIAYTSVPKADAPGNPGEVIPDHLGTEEHLKASGLGYSFLRNNLYPELSIGGWAHAIASGQLVTNAGDGGTAFVTREDCALAAAGALAKDDTGEHVVYEISGPEAVTPAGIATLLGELSGREVAVVGVDDAAYAAGLAAAGVPEPLVGVLVSFGAAVREGYLDLVTNDVETLVGRPATPLATVLQSAKGELVPATV